MGCLGELLGAAIGNQSDLKDRLKGRSPEQQKVIKYFAGEGGCLSKGLTDAEYDDMVRAVINGTNWKQKALDKIGLDEDQLR